MTTIKFIHEITIFTNILSFYTILLSIIFKSNISSFIKPIAIRVNTNNNRNNGYFPES